MLLYLYRADINGTPRKAPWFIFSLKDQEKSLQNLSTASFIEKLHTVPDKASSKSKSKSLPPATSIEQHNDLQLPIIQLSNNSNPLPQFSVATIQNAISNKVGNAPQKLSNDSKKNPSS